uniref:uncharacterized protein LOC108950606 n=1 Tax=Ciona intestinalis TaxID=7719 RepID=UPI000EF4EC90|nr:uncharacterized protein LOC108950606 [Ciona intestinalis]|eukprot:XP_026695325.1 uncharacterized protein LOC108950606 [Ciona intestinalis]
MCSTSVESDEIIQEFMNIPEFEIEESIDTEIGLGSQETCACQPEKLLKEIMKKLDPSKELTNHGEVFAKKWIANANCSKNIDILEINIADYPSICHDSDRFFNPAPSDKFSGPHLLLMLIKECSKSTRKIESSSGLTYKGISEVENDGIEYLAGYTVMKASKKFGSEMLRSDLKRKTK